jgi:hypothetical protein
MKIYTMKEHEWRTIVIFNMTKVFDYQVLQCMGIYHTHLLILHTARCLGIKAEVTKDTHSIWCDGDSSAYFILEVGPLEDLRDVSRAQSLDVDLITSTWAPVRRRAIAALRPPMPAPMIPTFNVIVTN